MSFCSKCGAKLNDNDKFCPDCGFRVSDPVRSFKENENISNDLKNIVSTNADNPSDKSRLCALLLWFFLGGFGAHYFYAGNSSKGVLYIVLLFASILVIPAFVLFVFLIIDLVKICTGDFVDIEGKKIIKW